MLRGDWGCSDTSGILNPRNEVPGTGSPWRVGWIVVLLTMCCVKLCEEAGTFSCVKKASTLKRYDKNLAKWTTMRAITTSRVAS
jgi:hypothetical protein